MNFSAVIAAISARRSSPPDTTPPTLVSAVVANATPTQITLTWSESMNSTISAATAFAVNSGHALSSHTYVDATHTYLTTSTAFVNGEAARTLAYTQPGTNNMKDLAGNLLANFSGTSITNNVSGGGSGTITIAWTPATTNPSGLPESTLTGYYVLYDTVSQAGTGVNYSSSQFFPGPSITSATLTGLTIGVTYYYAVVAYDGTTQGIPEEELSKVAS